MHKVWVIAWREFFTNVRRPGFIFVTLMIPGLGLIGSLIAAFAGGALAQTVGQQFAPVTRPTGYVNQSPLVLPTNTNFVAYATEPEGQTALSAERIGALAIIPADYLATGSVTIYTEGNSPFGSESASGRLREFLRGAVLTLVTDQQIRERASQPLRANFIQLSDGGQSTSFNPLTFVVPFVLAILLIVSIFTSSGFMLQSVSEEKETRVMEVLLSSVSATQLLTGKIIGLGALGLLQVAVWFGGLGAVALLGLSVLSFIGGITFSPVTLILGGVYFLLGYLLYATLMAVSGSIATSLREGQQVSALFTFAAVLPLSFSSLILPRPNGIVSQALSLFPLSSPMMMMMRLAVTTVPPIEIALSLTFLVLFLGFAIWGGARIFRAGLLMYGKRLSVTEIWRALRSA